MSRQKPHDPRQIALFTLQEVLLRDQDIQSALDVRLRSPGLDPRDASLATELAYGVLRHKGRLEFILSRLLHKPRRLPPACVPAFCMAAYERLFLDRIPEYATRTWLAAHVRKAWGAGIAGVATAFVTRVSGMHQDLHDPTFYRHYTASTEEFVSAYYSLPAWIVALWIASYGLENTELFAGAQLQPSLLGLRINPRHPESSDFLERMPAHESLLQSGTWAVACAREHTGVIFPNLDSDLRRGLVSRQSPAGIRVLDALGMETAPGPVWDVCSGYGGKTCYLLERAETPVRASDVNHRRLKGLIGQTLRLGLRRPAVAVAGASQPLPWREKPGTILVDAPCTGLGVLSRRPDSKWRRKPSDVRMLVQLQHAILRNAALHLQSGARLAYITCTLNPAENEQRIDQLLLEDPGLRRIRGCDWGYTLGLREFFWAAVVERR